MQGIFLVYYNFSIVLSEIVLFVIQSFSHFQTEVEKHPLHLKVCETRWACHFEAIRDVEANFSVLLDLLETIEAVEDARGLKIQMKGFEFLITF